VERKVLFGSIVFDNEETSSLFVLWMETDSEVLNILQFFLTLFMMFEKLEELIKLIYLCFTSLINDGIVFRFNNQSFKDRLQRFERRVIYT
jgi:hypothetical protein